jgi:polyisoprenoid-binding protein YceI
VWHLDPARSSVDFQVPHFYGLMTVKGRFGRYDGVLDLRGLPSAELTVDAASLDTKNAKRDRHLRSADFFDVENHPEVGFVAEAATLDREVLRMSGRLLAAGEQIPLEVEASLREVDGELEIDATATADHRELGMTWSPLGIMRSPSRLFVRGRLTRDGAGAR